MRIAIHCCGDWNDAEVTPSTLQRLLMRGDVRFSGTNTGKVYGETVALPIYNADEWPGWPSGFTYLTTTTPKPPTQQPKGKR